MKHHIIPLLIACFMILTSMSECRNVDFDLFQETLYSPVNAELNGIPYTSGEYTYKCGFYYDDRNPFRFSEHESGFEFSFDRDIVSDDGSVAIFMNLRSELPFELNRQYAIGTNLKDGYAGIILKEDGARYTFMSTGGYVVFTERTGDNPYVLSGRFEFTARNEKKDSVINVTNGTFENLYCQ